MRTGAAFWGTEPAGVCATSLRGHQATKCTIFQLQSRRTRAAQHLGASSCCSSTTTASGDPPTATALPAAARSHRGYVLRTAQRQYQCSRRCRTLHKSTPRCAMAAGFEAARTFFICACLRARCWPRLTNLYFPLRQQSYDLLAEAARLETFMVDPVNVSKSSLCRAWRSRATGTDRCRARLAHSCVCPALVRACWRRLRAARTLAGAAVCHGWTYRSPGALCSAATGPRQCTVVPCPPGQHDSSVCPAFG